MPISVLKALRSIAAGQALSLCLVQHFPNSLSPGPFFLIAPMNTALFCKIFRSWGRYCSTSQVGEVLIEYEVLNTAVIMDLFRKEKDENIGPEPYFLVS